MKKWPALRIFYQNLFRSKQGDFNNLDIKNLVIFLKQIKAKKICHDILYGK